MTFVIQILAYIANYYKKTIVFKTLDNSSNKARVVWRFVIYLSIVYLIFIPIFIANTFNYIPTLAVLISHTVFTIFLNNFILFVVIKYPTVFTIYGNIKQNGNSSALKKIPEEAIEKITASIHKLIFEEQVYKDSKIDIAIFADKCNVPKYLLVQFLNQHYGKPFPDFINKYRIEEAIRLLSEKDRNKYGIDIISNMCGFNYRSSFYSAFRRQTGMSPMQYMKNETARAN